jgi:hypothetical protein
VFDWARLMNAAEDTLETVVLEHWYCIENIEMDTWGGEEYIEHNSSVWDEDAFAKVIVLFVAGMKAPKLQCIHLYGIFSARKSSSEGKSQLAKACNENGVECEARLGRWCLYDYDDDIAHGLDGRARRMIAMRTVAMRSRAGSHDLTTLFGSIKTSWRII